MITDDQKRRLFYLHLDPSGPELPLTRAAAEVGISLAAAYRLVARHPR